MQAARAWSNWEGETSRLIPQKKNMLSQSSDKFALAFASIENHYFMNKGFIKEGQLIRDAKKLVTIQRAIPTYRKNREYFR